VTLGQDASGSAGSSSGSGTISLSGGVSVTGNLSAGVTLEVEASGQSGPIAVVDSGNTLAFYGASAEGSSGASLVVNGNLWFGAAVTTVQPTVVINSGAKFTINSANGLAADGWILAASGRVVLTASVNRAMVHVKKITQCLGTVEIQLSASASVSAGGSSIGFTYDSSNNAAELAKCAVMITDSTGASVTLTSTTTMTTSGRRLLSTSGTAYWGPNNMTFTYGPAGPGTSGAMSLAPSIFLLLCIMSFLSN